APPADADRTSLPSLRPNGTCRRMKNFLRAIRCAVPYRRRLIFSIVCAILAAAFWSLNIAVIYPVLCILDSRENLQKWVANKIETTQKDIHECQGRVDGLNAQFRQLQEDSRNGKLADEAWRIKRERDLSLELARWEGRLEPA